MCSHACGTEFSCRLPFSPFVTEAGLTARDVSQAYVCPGMPLPTPQGHTRRTLCPSLPPLQGRTCRHCLMTTVVVTVSPSRCMCAVRLLCVCLLRTTLVRTRPWCRTPAPTARHGPQGMHPPPVPSHVPRRPPTYDRPRLPSSRLSPPDLLGSPPRHDSNCTRAQCTAGVTDATPVADVGLGTRGRVARAELVPYADALARDFGHGERERGERSWPTTDRRLRAALR